MTETMTSELRPWCPYCLSTNVRVRNYGHKTYQMACDDCKSESPEVEIRPVMIEVTRKAWIRQEWPRVHKSLEQEG